MRDRARACFSGTRGCDSVHGVGAVLAAPAHANGASWALQRNPQRSRTEGALTGCRGRGEIR